MHGWYNKTKWKIWQHPLTKNIAAPLPQNIRNLQKFCIIWAKNDITEFSLSSWRSWVQLYLLLRQTCQISCHQNMIVMRCRMPSSWLSPLPASRTTISHSNQTQCSWYIWLHPTSHVLYLYSHFISTPSTFKYFLLTILINYFYEFVKWVI